MITAKEARSEMEAYFKGREKINKVLDHIDGVIRIACRNGLDLVFIKENTFHNLSVDQMKTVINELEDLGYNVKPVYEEHTEIQLTGRVGYNIVW